jgi:chromosome segregation ATPase
MTMVGSLEWPFATHATAISARRPATRQNEGAPRVDTNHNFLQTGGQPVSDRMRELLARAAQDHVYEQRSTGQVLDEIHQRLEGIEWLLREVRERELSGLTTQLDSVRGQVDELYGKPPEWAEGLAEHIESVGEKVKPVAELPSLWADVGVIAENVDEGLSRIQTVLDSSKSITDATLRAAQQMDDLTKRLDRLAGTMEAASVRFNRLDKTLADLGHRSEKLEHQINGVTGKVDQSLSDMAERVEQGLDAVNGRVEGVGGRLDGIDGRIEGLSGKLKGIEGHFQGLEAKIEGVDDRVDGVNQRIGQLPVTLEIGELHRKLAAIGDRPFIDPTDRFDALEKRLSEAIDPLIDELRARPDRDEAEETLSKIIESSRADITKHMEILREDLLRQVGGVHDDVSKKVEGAQQDMTKRMSSVHEDLMKRLITLEETMLALAEALFRPRRESKE